MTAQYLMTDWLILLHLLDHKVFKLFGSRSLSGRGLKADTNVSWFLFDRNQDWGTEWRISGCFITNQHVHNEGIQTAASSHLSVLSWSFWCWLTREWADRSLRDLMCGSCDSDWGFSTGLTGSDVTLKFRGCDSVLRQQDWQGRTEQLLLSQCFLDQRRWKVPVNGPEESSAGENQMFVNVW